MLPIAALVIGAAFVVEGGVLIARYAESMTEMPANRSMQLDGGVSTEFLGGCAGIVLGILALVGIAPQVLISVAALVFGATLLWGSAATNRLESFEFSSTTHPMGHEVAREAMFAASGAKAFIGLATVVLSILALTHIATVPLTLVAMLIVGASIVLTGSAVTGWFMSGTARMH